MKNLLTALKELGKKMTGVDITGSNLVTVVDDISKKYTGGGGGGEGGSGGTLVVRATENDDITTLDKTWQEIHDAVLTRGVTIIRRGIEGESDFITLEILSNVDYDSETGEYFVATNVIYTTTDADGYPMYDGK